MTRGNPSNLQPFDPEIDMIFHRLVRHHLVPFEHPKHYVIGDFDLPIFNKFSNLISILFELIAFLILMV